MSHRRVEIDSLYKAIDFYTTVTRAKFEEINSELFREAMKPVDMALRDAGLEKDKIHDIVLVGGSTRIPKMQKVLSEYFNNAPLKKSVNPDEAVAYGAAVQAAILSGDTSDLLGIKRADGTMSTLIRRNAALPTKTSQVFTTHDDNQESVLIQIYEGEKPMAEDNNLLGKFLLRGIEPAPRGVPQVQVTFDIDANGILNVYAEDLVTGKQSSITISNDGGRLTEDDVVKMKQEAEDQKKHDEKNRQRVAAKNALESFAFSMKMNLDEMNDRGKLKGAQKKNLDRCEEIINWLDHNPSADKSEYEKLKAELESLPH